ncbi:MAG: glycine betaine ABC transporter substrate-binding protein [Chloroflexia bacterium]
MKKRILVLSVLTTMSMLLSACGGNPATPVPPTATGAMMVEATATAPVMVEATATGAMMVDATATTGGSMSDRKVVVSSKDFTEEFLLGEMYALALENAGVPVERKLNLGGSDIAHAAMEKGGADGGIDLYPEYTNTGLTVILGAEGIADAAQAYEAVKAGYKEKFNMTWLDRSPLNDTQAFVTTQANSDRLGIKSLADLCAKAGEVRISSTPEFRDRPDAYPRLKEIYGACEFKEIKPMAPNLFYTTLLNGDVDVTQAFSTDGPIAGNGLVLLADPKNYGLPYNIAPVVRDDVLALYPQIAGTLNAFAPRLTNEVMSALNWEVDGKAREYEDVAKEWMQKEGLIK